MKQYIFGYGSLMNPRSLQKTLPGKTIGKRVCLRGYRRKFNIPVNGYLYLNIIPETGAVTCGVVVAVSDSDLEQLKAREVGYRCFDVSNNIIDEVDGRVFAFIAPDNGYPDLKILQSYINTCLQGVPENEREKWLGETIIDNEIEDDTLEPKYQNVDDR